jgi:hypothetical protein
VAGGGPHVGRWLRAAPTTEANSKCGMLAEPSCAGCYETLTTNRQTQRQVQPWTPCACALCQRIQSGRQTHSLPSASENDKKWSQENGASQPAWIEDRETDVFGWLGMYGF